MITLPLPQLSSSNTTSAQPQQATRILPNTILQPNLTGEPNPNQEKTQLAVV